MTRVNIAIVICFLTFPTALHAAVSFSEIAWMGTAASANDEWIELYNDGSALDVTDWRITDGANLDITLSGTLPSGYSVLERTSDESAAGSAWLIYTGALVNTGATLRLTDATDALIDQVAGGTDWEQIGGDNTTKDTAQYTTAGWVTAAPTPGGAPPPTASRTVTGTETVDEEDESTAATANTNSATSNKNSGETVRLELPGVTLKLAIDAQTVAYVNQPVDFAVTPSGVGEVIKQSLVYDWNFGDGITGNGKEVTHTFTYPGTYVVNVYGAYKRQEQVARHEITVLPVAVSLTTNAAGDVQVHNDSAYEIDISHYRVVGADAFTFPPRSILLPQQTVTIPRAKLGKQPEQLVLVYDALGAELAMSVPARLAESSSATLSRTAETQTVELSSVAGAPVAFAPTTPPRQASTANFSFATTAAAAPEPVATSVVATTSPLVAAAAASDPPTEFTNRSYLFLALLLVGAVAALYLTPQRNDFA